MWVALDEALGVVDALLAILIIALVAGSWWASNRGYVSWTGEECTAEGFDPVPSYEELVADYGKSPYCGRLVRDETWFLRTHACAAFRSVVRQRTMLQDGDMSLLTCPLCGREQDASGPGVSSSRDDAGGWLHSWTPFIEDLRGTPSRLVHPKCFAVENGIEPLVVLVTEHDRRMRLELSKHR